MHESSHVLEKNIVNTDEKAEGGNLSQAAHPPLRPSIKLNSFLLFPCRLSA